jgi:predicted DNA-binding ribbon-helix-helix protein
MQHPLVIQIEEKEWLLLKEEADRKKISIEQLVEDLIDIHLSS